MTRQAVRRRWFWQVAACPRTGQALSFHVFGLLLWFTTKKWCNCRGLDQKKTLFSYDLLPAVQLLGAETGNKYSLWLIWHTCFHLSLSIWTFFCTQAKIVSSKQINCFGDFRLFNRLNNRCDGKRQPTSPSLPRLSSQCSVTCGVGRVTRQVDCSNYHLPVDPSFCHPDEKPAMEQECTSGPCSSVYNRQRINDQPYGYPQDPGRHPGHSSWNVPSADNQWRTGPWGAVCSDWEHWLGGEDLFLVLWWINFR